MSQQIHTGRWTDWTYGSIIGENLTLKSRDATYLISFIATFDVWIATAAWYLIAFIIHQSMTIRKPRNAAAHQVQVALRNCSTTLSFVRYLLFIGWAWRHRSWKLTVETWAMSLFPVTMTILFVAAGIASSRIASTGEVLLMGGNCGLISTDIQNELNAVQVQLSSGYQDGIRMTLSNSYAQAYYQNPFVTENFTIEDTDISDMSSSQGYSTVALRYTSSNTDCPFENVCSAPALKLDTGYLDSHKDFGLNQPQENRVAFRKVTTCSPLSTTGFSDNTFTSVNGFTDVGIYSYGNNSYQPTRFGATQFIPSPDATFVYSKDTYRGSQTAYYMMIASTLQLGSNGPLFIPTPDLSMNATRPISLIFLANRAFYQGIVNDPWFNATSPIKSSQDGNVHDTLYQSNNPGAVLGCTEQLQLCNPNAKISNNCTDLDSWYRWGDFTTYYKGNNMTMLEDIGMNQMQQITAMMLQDASLAGTVWNVVDQLGVDALVASNYVSEQETFWSPPLLDNQWQVEVANWFSIGLAHTQRLFIANYRKPGAKALVPFFQSFPSYAANENAWCNNQKVRNTNYTTFSVLGLGLNFGIGVFVLLCGYLVPYIVPRLQGRYADKHGKISKAREQWIMNNALQLQRVAYEALGIGGTWSRHERRVPITNEFEKFMPPTQRSVAAALQLSKMRAQELELESLSEQASENKTALLPMSTNY